MRSDLIEIKDARDERIRFFAFLKGEAPRIAERGLILVEGEQQVERVLKSALRLDTLFMEPGYYERLSALLTDEKLAGVQCFSAERQVMEQTVGYRMHRGIMALAARPSPLDLAAVEGPALALNALNDPENVGSIVRACSVFGIRHLIVDDATSDPYMRRAIRVSMGGVLDISVCYVDSLAPALLSLRQAGLPVVAVENAAGSKALFGYLPQRSTVFVLGNERTGIAADVLAACDGAVEIPMTPGLVTSLNVSAAAAVVLSYASWRWNAGRS